MGFRAIERVTGVNHNTVINWVKQAGTCLPDAPEASEIPEVTRGRREILGGIIPPKTLSRNRNFCR